METQETQDVQPQGVWVSAVVRDLSSASEPAPEPSRESTPQTAGTAEKSGAPAPSSQEIQEAQEAQPAQERVPAHTTEPPEPHEPQDEPRPVRSRALVVADRDGEDQDFARAGVVGRVRSGEPWPRRMTRWVRSNVRAGQQDARLAELIGAVRVPLTTGRRIGVVGVRGGVGSSTVTLLLGSVLAARRDDLVLAVDGDREVGSLLWRSGLDGDDPAPDAVAELPQAHVGSAEELASRIPRTAGGLWVLPEAATSAELGRFFGITVLDCGGDLLGGRSPGPTLADAHAGVLVAAATVDGVRAARLALDGLPSGRRSAEDAPTAHVVALVSRTPGTEGLRVGHAVRYLEQTGAAVVHLPYDRHLAAGARIDPARLAEPTLLAATDLAGRVLARARADVAVGGR